MRLIHARLDRLQGFAHGADQPAGAAQTGELAQPGVVAFAGEQVADQRVAGNAQFGQRAGLHHLVAVTRRLGQV